MALIADSLDEYDQLSAYRQLRSARRRNRITKVDLFDAFYKAYLTGILAIAAIYGGTAALGSSKLNDYHLGVVEARGAAFAGLAVALAVAVGLRSGGRGGPLAFERADVRHILLSPLDKRNTIRKPALRQLRHMLFLGTAFGAGAGVIASARLPHALIQWVLSGAAFGAVTVMMAFGVALFVGGLQIRRWLADLLALLVLAWSAVDAWLKLKTSPMTWTGAIAIVPLKFEAFAVGGLVVALAAAGLGAAYVNRLSIEAAERRSRLIGQLRFAATLQDVRTVMVIQRQLAQEHARVRPWIRLRPTKKIGVRNGRVAVGVYIRRSIAGMLRWPLVRYARLLVFVAIASASLVGVWGGTTALVLVAGVALWLAGLDLIEALAQEVDHPDRGESMPRQLGAVYQQQLIVPFVVLFFLEIIAYVIINALGDSEIVSKYGPVIPISTLCAIGGAAMAVTQRPAVPTGSVETPEIAGVKFILRMVLPPAFPIVGLLPVVAGAHGWAKTHTIDGMLQAQSTVVTVSVIVAAIPVAWLRYRHEFANFMTMPTSTSADDSKKDLRTKIDETKREAEQERQRRQKQAQAKKSPAKKKKGKK